MRLLIALIYILSLFLLTGCQPKKLTSESADDVEVIIEEGVAFPKSLAGTWKSQGRSSWEFVIERNGTISSVIHSIGSVKLEPRQVTEVPMKQKGKGVFRPGLWTVRYSHRTNSLSIEIVLDYFRAQKGNEIVEGSSTDLFIGPITIDGQQWEPEWFSFPKFVVSTDVFKDRELPVDYNDNPRATLIFEKVEP